MSVEVTKNILVGVVVALVSVFMTVFVTNEFSAPISVRVIESNEKSQHKIRFSITPDDNWSIKGTAWGDAYLSDERLLLDVDAVVLHTEGKQRSIGYTANKEKIVTEMESIVSVSLALRHYIDSNKSDWENVGSATRKILNIPYIASQTIVTLRDHSSK